MNDLYEQSLGLGAVEPSLEDRIDQKLYEPTCDGVSNAEFDLKWIGELVDKKRAALNEARDRFNITTDPHGQLMVELCEWELRELVDRQVELRDFLPRLRKLNRAAEQRAFQSLLPDEEEPRPSS